MVGASDLTRSAEFYNAILAPLGLKEVECTKDYVGYAENSDRSKIEFYVTLPFNQEPATSGNGSMVALKATSRQAVDAFHKTALKNRGRDAGTPGPRPENGEIYYAYIWDFDGNKICAFCDQ
jgi:predicted lactoylglutathione lyase